MELQRNNKIENRTETVVVDNIPVSPLITMKTSKIYHPTKRHFLPVTIHRVVDRNDISDRKVVGRQKKNHTTYISTDTFHEFSLRI